MPKKIHNSLFSTQTFCGQENWTFYVNVNLKKHHRTLPKWRNILFINYYYSLNQRSSLNMLDIGSNDIQASLVTQKFTTSQDHCEKVTKFIL